MLNRTKYVLAGVTISLVAWAKDFYEQQVALVAVVLVLFAAWKSRRFFRWPLVAMGAYLGLRAIWGVMESRGLPTELWLTTSVLSLRNTLVLFLMAAAAVLIDDKNPEQFFNWAVPAVAVTSIFNQPLLGSNLSLNAALLVAGLCFVEKKYFFRIAALVALVVFFKQRGLTGTVMLAVVVFRRFPVQVYWLSGLLVGAKLWFTPGMLSSKSDRLEFYALTVTFFKEHVNPWVGQGIRSFVAFGPIIQSRAKFQMHNAWLSLHSDWIECVFELGFVGWVLAVWLYVDSLARADSPTRLALVLMGISAIGYFPLSVPAMCAFSVWLVVRAQTTDKTRILLK